MRHYIYLVILVLSGCSSSNPKTIFEERTGLLISDSKSKIDVIDKLDPFGGQYSMIFKTTESQIKLWLDNAPPWGNLKWHKGSVPHEIGINVQFNFTDRVGIVTVDNGKSAYYGNQDLEKLLNDITNYYCYMEDCCSDRKGQRFHNGRLLIIQPRTKMVYYEVWNF